MKPVLLFAFLLGLSSISFAQDAEAPADSSSSPWTTGGKISLGMSQVFVSNWSGGGVSSVSGNGLINLYADYKKGKYYWNNELTLGYGLLAEEDKNAVKTDDKIVFNSSLERQLPNEKWTIGINNAFRTQFAPGYVDEQLQKELLSDFFAPAYNTFSLGFNYHPNKAFAAHLAPISYRLTFVDNQELADKGSYGVDGAVYDDVTGDKIQNGKNLRHEIGAFVRMTYKKEIATNVVLDTKLELFSNYLEDPQNVDVYFDLLLDMKINGTLSTTIGVNLIYDDDINIPLEADENDQVIKEGPRLQLKEVFTLSINYTFSNKAK